MFDTAVTRTRYREEGLYGTQQVDAPVSRGRWLGRGWGSQCRDRLWQRRQP